jgi:molybdopterin-guanine dinucleotide biosynthesis protein A
MLALIIQAGGESQRMGQDKGLVLFLGEPLVLRVVARLAALPGRILITTNNLQGYRKFGFPLHEDMLPGRGPLGGLYTALSVAEAETVVVVACDMPFISALLLEHACQLLEGGAFDAVIPQTDGGTEPFHAVYRRESCLPSIKKALDEGAWRVDAWFGSRKIRYLSPDEVDELDPSGLAFLNVNTREELEQAEQIARRIELSQS